VNTLHLLPGESRGDTAEIVLTPAALKHLRKLLDEADEHRYACGRFTQSDGSEYTLCVDIVNEPGSGRAWRDRPLAYLRHDTRNIRYDARQRPYNANLLANDLYVARKAKRHRQDEAADEIGVSRGFISYVENQRTTPRGDNFKKLCEYIGTEMADYALQD
jgi:DNA-binding XRE family transcriptional regulator